MQPPGNERGKAYTFDPGHMTKIAVMPIYGKNIKKCFSVSIALKLGMYYSGLLYYKGYINELSGLTLTYFMTKSNLVP